MSLSFDDKITFVRRWYAAYNARDVREICALAHPSIEIMPMRPLMDPIPGTAFHGPAGMRTLMHWTFQNFPRIYAEHVAAEDARGLLLDETLFIYDIEAPAPHRSRVWALWDIEPDGVRRVIAYADARAAHDAIRRTSTLTPREREVFALLARGLTATQIADELVLSPLTVRTHIQNGKDRLGAKTRMQALSMALQSGEITA
jgi:DNA-binding CsgD family transcriptional regulator